MMIEPGCPTRRLPPVERAPGGRRSPLPEQRGPVLGVIELEALAGGRRAPRRRRDGAAHRRATAADAPADARVARLLPSRGCDAASRPLACMRQPRYEGCWRFFRANLTHQTYPLAKSCRGGPPDDLSRGLRGSDNA